MPQLERFLILWYVFCSFVPHIKHSVSSTFLLYLRLPNALYGTSFWKRWFFFHKKNSSWSMPQLEGFLILGFLFICTKHKVFGILNFLTLSVTPLMPWNVFWKNCDFFFIKYFKLVHAPTWKIPQFMVPFLFICSKLEIFGIFNFLTLSATP